MPRTKFRNDRLLFQKIRESGCDAIIVFSMENVFYASGAFISTIEHIRKRMAAVVMTADGTDFLVCARNELSVAEQESWVAQKYAYIEFQQTPMQTLADALKDHGLANKRLGIEKGYLMVEPFEELQRLLPEASWVSCDKLLEEVVSIKTPEHVEIIGQINRLTEEALVHAFAETRRGDTERDLANRITHHLLRLGADTVRFLIVTAGDNAKHAHPPPSEKVLQPGDIIRIDVGGLFQGHGSDIARMGIVGEPSAEQRETYNLMRTVQREVIAAMKPGVKASEVFQACVDGYKKRGITYFRPHIGHSMSVLGGHDNPLLHPQNPWPLAENMVMAVEPIYTDSENRRYTVEDIVHITAAGPKILTTFSNTEEIFPVS